MLKGKNRNYYTMTKAKKLRSIQEFKTLFAFVATTKEWREGNVMNAKTKHIIVPLAGFDTVL